MISHATCGILRQGGGRTSFTQFSPSAAKKGSDCCAHMADTSMSSAELVFPNALAAITSLRCSGFVHGSRLLAQPVASETSRLQTTAHSQYIRYAPAWPVLLWQAEQPVWVPVMISSSCITQQALTAYKTLRCSCFRPGQSELLKAVATAQSPFSAVASACSHLHCRFCVTSAG